jgi:hypothetical protein
VAAWWHCSDALAAKSFIKRLLRVEPSERVTAADLLRDPWICKYKTDRRAVGDEPSEIASDVALVPSTLRIESLTADNAKDKLDQLLQAEYHQDLPPLPENN